MSEFKFVQWGKGTPVDYQRLNAMMINEQYLKDRSDIAPRGVLAWKVTDSDTTSTAGSRVNFTGIGSVSFNVEANRMLKISLFVYTVTNSGAGTTASTNVAGNTTTYRDPNILEFDLDIDGTLVGNDGGGQQRIYSDFTLTTSNPAQMINTAYFTTTPLTAGTHTVSPKIYSYPTAVTAKGQVRLLVEDIGAWVGGSS